ncbi:MAG: flavodoxin [Desulfotalea sp.]|nr:MAG: flavodoxin [Desulfotalea sp.]
MASALIIYGSTTGNTEMVANRIGEVFSDKGLSVVVKNVTDATVAELGNGHDITLLGASTWGDDAIEFQEDFDSFFQELDAANLKDKMVALFGCGDSSYEFFCGAVDELEEKMEKLQANVVNVSLRIDGDPDDAESEVVEWAEDVASHL